MTDSVMSQKKEKEVALKTLIHHKTTKATGPLSLNLYSCHLLSPSL
jgi:hypothetical protein